MLTNAKLPGYYLQIKKEFLCSVVFRVKFFSWNSFWEFEIHVVKGMGLVLSRNRFCVGFATPKIES